MQIFNIAFLTWLSDSINWLKEMYLLLVDYGHQFIFLYSKWGPLAWIFAAWVESIFPALLLSLITVINIQAAQIMLGPVLGWVVGFLLSWVGTAIGAITMFSFWRYVSDKIKIFKNRKKKQEGKDYEKVSHESTKGVMALFSISSIPMMPSSIINFTYAFTKMKTKVFIKTTIIAKFFMMLFMSVFAGFFDWLFADLIRAVISSIVIFGFVILVNKYEKQIVATVKKIAYKSKMLKKMDEEYLKEQEESKIKEQTDNDLESK